MPLFCSTHKKLNWNFMYLSWLRQYQTGIFFKLSSVVMVITIIFATHYTIWLGNPKEQWYGQHFGFYFVICYEWKKWEQSSIEHNYSTLIREDDITHKTFKDQRWAMTNKINTFYFIKVSEQSCIVELYVKIEKGCHPRLSERRTNRFIEEVRCLKSNTECPKIYRKAVLHLLK